MRLKISILITALIFSVVSTTYSTDFYRCTSSDGSSYISNTYTPENCTNTTEIKYIATTEVSGYTEPKRPAKEIQSAKVNPVQANKKEEIRPTKGKTVSVSVNRVLDGDTIDVMLEGKPARVRYVGIDTPETSQEYGSDATKENQNLVGRSVELEYDIIKEDRYGRILTYVWTGDRLINEELVKKGLAVVATFPPNVKYQKVYIAAQEKARLERNGFWKKGGLDRSPYFFRANLTPIKPK